MNRLFLLSALVASVAWADRTIVVDGDDTDWAGVNACFTESGGDVTGGIDLNRACIENDNSQGSNGFLYSLQEATTTLPTNQDTYFGVAVDLNQDGVINDSDEAYAVYYPAGYSGSAPVELQVYTAGTFALKRRYASTTDCGGSGSDNGWSGVRNGNLVEFKVAYGCIPGLTYGNDYRLVELGTYPNFDLTPLQYYDGTSDTLASQVSTIPDVVQLVSISRPASVTLVWSNPTPHEGVLILKGTTAPTRKAVPNDHTVYSLNQAIGNMTVAYVDDGGSSVSRWTDTSVSKGTTYYYEVYNQAQAHTYSNNSGTGQITGVPGGGGTAQAAWCYGTGLLALLQPATELGAAVFQAGNNSSFTGNITTPSNAATDGDERFRPVQLANPVQGRPLVWQFQGQSGDVAIVADQAGYVYAIRLSDGSKAWTANFGMPLAGAVQGQPVAQLYSKSNAAFQGAIGAQDLIFVGTRKTGTGANSVYALSSIDGTVVWQYAPGDLGYISGGLLVDPTNNRLYVGSNATNGPPFRILSTIDGSEVSGSKVRALGGVNLGSIDTGLVRGSSASGAPQVVFGDSNKRVFGVDLSTGQSWTTNGQMTGSVTSFPLTINDGSFVAALSDGTVQHWGPDASGKISRLWSAKVASPSGLKFMGGATPLIYVGSTGGLVYTLDFTQGTATAHQIAASSVADVGTPTIDTAVNRLHVSLSDGRLCAYPLPLP